MRKSIAALCLLLSLSPHAAAKNPEWITLIRNGELSDRWQTKGNWQIERDDIINLTPRPGERGWKRFDAYLWSLDRYGTFEVEFEYRMPPKGNSGFYFHVDDKSNPVKTGIEVQLADLETKQSAKLTDHHSGGVIPGIPPNSNAARPADEWNQVQIVVQPEMFRVTINGTLVNEVSLSHANIKDRPAAGYVGFQDHGLPFALRHVRIRSLGE